MGLQEDNLRSIAEAIRKAEGEDNFIAANQFADRIRALANVNTLKVESYEPILALASAAEYDGNYLDTDQEVLYHGGAVTANIGLGNVIKSVRIEEHKLIVVVG